MVQMVVKTKDGRTETFDFGHGREAITEAQKTATRLLAENRWAREVIVTGALDY